MINVHVDVDNLWIYEDAYRCASGLAQEALYEQALPDFLSVLSTAGIQATFFVVGRDLQYESCRRFCQRAASLGHEIANHTYSHPAHLYRLSPKEKEHEIRACGEAIENVINRKVVGFRAPGYYIDREMIGVLIRNGYLYDSSVMPSFVNLLMKLYIRLKSGGDIDMAFGRRRYGLVSRSIRRIEDSVEKRSIVEIPITTTAILRLPIHTTFVYLLGDSYLKHVARVLGYRATHIAYVFHAIDTLRVPPDSALCGRVPALRWTYERRLNLVRSILGMLDPGRVVTSEAMCSSLADGHHPPSWLLSYGLYPYR